MLAASGHPVSPITLRSWVYRGHISRQEGGYDLREILDYIERRESTMPQRSIPTREQIESAAQVLDDLARKLREADPSNIRQFEFSRDTSHREDIEDWGPLRQPHVDADEYKIRIEWM